MISASFVCFSLLVASDGNSGPHRPILSVLSSIYLAKQVHFYKSVCTVHLPEFQLKSFASGCAEIYVFASLNKSCNLTLIKITRSFSSL